MKKSLLVLMCLQFLMILPAQDLSSDVKNLDLDVDTAVSLALANNLDLEREKIKFEGYKWAAITSWNTFIPTASMSATMSRSNLSEDDRTSQVTGIGYYSKVAPGIYDYVVPTTVESTRNQWSLMAQLNISLNLHARMLFEIYQAGVNYKGGKINLETAEKRVILSVKQGFYNLIVLGEDLKITEQNVNAAKRRYDQAVLLFRSGQKNELSMLQAEIAYENLLPGQIELKNAYATAIMEFKQLLGLKNDVDLVIIGNIEIERLFKLDGTILIESLVKERLEIKAMETQIMSLQNSRSMAISNLTPSFMISFSMDPMFQDNPIEDSWVYEDENWKQSGGALSLTFQIPIGAYVPFSKEQMAIVQSQFAIQEMAIRLEKLYQTSAVDVQNIVLNLNTIVERLKNLERNLQLAERTLELTELQYNSGSVELSQVEDSQDELNKAKYNLLKAKYDYVVGLLNLEYTLNTSIDKIIDLSEITEEEDQN